MTISSRVKLSKRLQTIFDLIPRTTQIVWDLCCDHGYLGIRCLQEGYEVHFVDCIPGITQKLEERFKESIDLPFHIHCIDAAFSPIQNMKDEVIIIAGVGGHSGIKILRGVIGKSPFNSLLIASVHRNRDLFVNFLEDHDLTLDQSVKIEDKGKEYCIDVFSRK